MFIHCFVHEYDITILENRLTATQMLDPESPCNLNSTPGHMVYIAEGVLKGCSDKSLPMVTIEAPFTTTQVYKILGGITV